MNSLRILSKKQVQALVLYSPAQIDRLERAGRFPKRVQLGPSRVGWVESEVLDWLLVRIRDRDRHTSSVSRTFRRMPP
jgi:prophage regulatory protein